MNMDERFFIGFGGILEIMGEKNRRRERLEIKQRRDKGRFNNPKENPKHK